LKKGKEIRIKVGEVVVNGEMEDSALAGRIYDALPFNVRASTWGKEIYFEIPVDSDIETPVSEVEKGDIAYWPEGRCLCLFFGPTPMSRGEKPIPASAVEVVGKMVSDYKGLEKVRSGEKVLVEKASP